MVQKLALRLALTAHYQDLRFSPLLPEGTIGALHVWTYDGVDIATVSNQVVKRLPLKQNLPPLPLL